MEKGSGVVLRKKINTMDTIINKIDEVAINAKTILKYKKSIYFVNYQYIYFSYNLIMLNLFR